MNSPSDISAYIKKLCENPPQTVVPDISLGIAFAINDLANLLDGKFKSALKPNKYNCQCINPLERGYSDESGNIMTLLDFGFSMTKHFASYTEENAEKAYNESRHLARAFIAKMIYDSQKGREPFFYALNSFLDAQFDIERIDFTGEGYHSGVMVLFKVKIEFIDCIEDLVNDSSWTI